MVIWTADTLFHKMCWNVNVSDCKYCVYLLDRFWNTYMQAGIQNNDYGELQITHETRINDQVIFLGMPTTTFTFYFNLSLLWGGCIQ